MAKILILDDELAFREMLEVLLTRHGHEVAIQPDGTAVVKGEIELAEVDLILVDIFMPDVEGMEVIRYLQSHWPGKKIIAMSGGGRDAGAQFFLTLAKSLGAVRALEKPFDLDVFISTVEELLEDQQLSA
ncbi:response regulator [Rhodovibrionaceae bacterium A322]